MQAKAISFQQAEEIKVEVNDLPALPARSRASMQWQTTSDIVRLSHAGSESAKPFQVSSGEAGEPLPVMQARSSCVLRNDSDIALVRLASDLTYAVPLVILMCAALAATLAYLVHIKLSMKDWPTTEAVSAGSQSCLTICRHSIRCSSTTLSGGFGSSFPFSRSASSVSISVKRGGLARLHRTLCSLSKRKLPRAIRHISSSPLTDRRICRRRQRGSCVQRWDCLQFVWIRLVIVG